MPVRLVINPRGDAELGAAADACMNQGAATPDVLASRLRDSYPRIAVHNGVEVDGQTLWYVYREGHWIAE